MKKPRYRNSKKLAPVAQLIRHHSLNRHPKLSECYQGIVVFKDSEMPSPLKLKSLRRMMEEKSKTPKLSEKIRIARRGRRWHWKVKMDRKEINSWKLRQTSLSKTGAVVSHGIKEELTFPCTFLSILLPLPWGVMLESNFTLQCCRLILKDVFPIFAC